MPGGKLMRRAVIALFIALLLCAHGAFHLVAGQTETPPAITPAVAEKIIARRARAVILALKKRDMAKLSSFVHPRKGVRFSPYNYVNPGDLTFQRAEVRNLMSDKRQYRWGEYDGSGDTIRLTFAKYYKRFIYDLDFASMREVGYNTPASPGTEIDNSREAYPRSIVVNYYYPGSEPYDGMDWRILRLVFQRQAGTWYLVGIIHNEWTI